MTDIKQKVKYTVEYDSTNDTLSEKLNVLLGNIITLIRTNNDDLLELSRITYGSEQMTGQPLLENDSLFQSNRKFQSDVVFLGTNKNNLVLSICFFDGRLVIAMNIDPYVEGLYMDIWNDIKSHTSFKNSFAIAKACRYIASGNQYNRYNINLPYIILNNKISLSVVYWTGTYSSGYMFYNSNNVTNGVDLVIYKTNEGNNTESLGCALWRYSSATNSYNNTDPFQLLTWSFNENLTNNMIKDHKLPIYMYNDSIQYYDSDYTLFNNSKHDMREWTCITNTYNSSNNVLTFYANTFMADLHTLGNLNGNKSYNNSMPVYDTVETSTTNYTNITNYHLSALCSAYNLPYLEGDTQAYFRKMHIPGFNKECKGELYLMWTPSTTAYESGDIVSCDGKTFAVITKGVVCWVARIE